MSSGAMTRTATWVVATGAVMLHLGATPASAGKTIPFTLTTAVPFNGGAGLECTGPWGRTSGCIDGSGVLDHYNFYSAEETIFSPYGFWSCRYHCWGDKPVKVNFCLLENKPTQVDLRLSEDTGSLTVNAPPECPRSQVTSLLGQDGEDAGTPRDVDSFDFAGRPGERVGIVLARGASGGSAKGIARLRVLDAGGGVLGQRAGELPLRLELVLAGAATIQVERPAEPGAFRGYYALEIEPRTGTTDGRPLRPRQNVEE